MAATKKSWKTRQFTKLREIPLTASYSLKEFEEIKKGFIPAQMEDKWFIYYDDYKLFFHRSWTGHAAYQVEFTERSDPMLATKAFCDEEYWAGDDVGYQVEFLDFLIANLLIGQSKPFPKPTGIREPSSGAFQHLMSGTGYAETPADTKQPWWKFWRRS